MRNFIFKVNKTETVLPITPPSFEVSHGINVETINIHTLGEVILPGYETLSTIKIDCMFPAKKYPFNQPKIKLNPYYYIKKIEDWCNDHTILQFIVSNTAVNVKAIVSSISYGERDGTGDVYATIELREYRELSVVQKNKTGNGTRVSDKIAAETNIYKVKSGDTLWAICRKYYGDATLYPKLASYNNIKNANLIKVGLKLQLPSKVLL
ncbi:MAG: LysM protein [Herbinix sp.]|nr:LysM protein [Herbinix sp.]